MTVGFPPLPAFPFGIDSDRTLFLVYNTSEAKIVSNNQPWSEEISIEPVAANKLEIWADNGFANISGELFYYDSVGKDSNGKVNKLKRCARNLGGKRTQFNPAGTWVRGFIIAEHHNQIVDTAIEIEKFIFELDAKVEELIDEPDCLDDFDCPIVTFDFDEIESDDTNCRGKTFQYTVGIQGNFTLFSLDFGDGNTTTSSLTGTHTYSPNSTIDPFVTVSNDKCQVVQTPTARDTPDEPPTTEIPTPFEIPIPVLPVFPQIEIPSFTTPSTTFALPPIVLPCLDFGGISGFSFNISVPSILNIVPPITPITISPVISPIIITGPTYSPITISAPTLTPITLSTPTLSPIIMEVPSLTPIILEAPSLTPIIIEAPSSFPLISFDTPPTLSCIVSIVCPNSTSMTGFRTLDDNFVDDLNMDTDIETESLNLGIPSIINVVAPKIPDIKISHNLPEFLKIEVPEFPNINVVFPKDFPTEISVINTIPEVIKIDAFDVPKVIKLDASSVPNVIKLEVPSNFPSTIKLDASGLPEFIQVKGIPETITLIHDIPREIIVKPAENLEIPLVYKGGPVPIQMDIRNLTGENDEDQPCFALVPCKK